MSKLFRDENDPLEKDIEAHLRDRVKAMGGIAYKFSSPARRGVPDRLVVFPSGAVHFVEIKAKRGKITKLQEQEMNQLVNLNQSVLVFYSKDAIDAWLKIMGRYEDALA